MFNSTQHPRDPATGRFVAGEGLGGSFTQFMDAAILEVRSSVNQKIQQATSNLFTKIVERTPQLDGQARGNWNCSQGSPSFQVIPHAKAQRGFEEALKPLTMDPADGIIYFTNVLPYIRVLEYGLYPNPPKLGTYVPRWAVIHGIPGPTWYKFSAGGFSKLAPQGMVRVSLVEFNVRTIR